MSTPSPSTQQLLAELNATTQPYGQLRLLDAHTDLTSSAQADIARYQMANGLEIIVWEDHNAPVVSYQTWFRVGSRHDPKLLTGIAHLFEHLMFKSTHTRAEGEYDRLMEKVGAQTNAATWVDWTYYKAKMPKWELKLAVELEADRMENLALAEDMLEREREVVKNERLMRVDNDPDGLLSERLYHEVFKVHPYGIPTIGWMEDIERISLEDCMRFYRTHYSPNNATIVVVGDVTSHEVLSLIQQHYGHIPPSELTPEVILEEPTRTEGTRFELSLPISTPRLTKAWRAFKAGTREQAALDLACELLAGSDSSRLHRVLVEERELASDISAWCSAWTQDGMLEISVTLRPEASIEEVEALLDEELTRFLESELPERELEKAKNGLESDFFRGLVDVSSRARQLGHHRATVGRWRELWAEADRLGSITTDEVLSAARDIIKLDLAVVAVALPNGEVAAEDGDEDDLEAIDDEALETPDFSEGALA